MSLRKPMFQLTALDFSQGSCMYNGVTVPLNKMKIKVKKAKHQQNVLNVLARQKYWPFGRITKAEKEILEAEQKARDEALLAASREVHHTHEPQPFDQEEAHNGRKDNEGAPNQPVEGG